MTILMQNLAYYKLNFMQLVQWISMALRAKMLQVVFFNWMVLLQICIIIAFVLKINRQKCKIDPLTFIVFHFSPLTFSFVNSVLQLSIFVNSRFRYNSVSTAVRYAWNDAILLFFLFINSRLKENKKNLKK